MLTRTTTDSCASDLKLDEWLADGVPPPERAALRVHLECCTRCALRLETIVVSRERFLQRQPSWQALHAAHCRPSALERRGPGVGDTRTAARWWWGAAALVAVALLALFRTDPGAYDRSARATRTKGGPSLGAFVQRGVRVQRIADGGQVWAGDRLRFVYSSDEPRYFALLQDDGRSASVQHPSGGHMQRLSPGRQRALDFSIVLDGVGRREVFHGLFCRTPVALEPLRAQLARGGSMTTPADCQADSLEFGKGAPAK